MREKGEATRKTSITCLKIHAVDSGIDQDLQQFASEALPRAI
jgi:hypothetical protein